MKKEETNLIVFNSYLTVADLKKKKKQGSPWSMAQKTNFDYITVTESQIKVKQTNLLFLLYLL